MKGRAALVGALLLAAIGGYVYVQLRKRPPEHSSPRTFASDILQAKRACADDYQCYLYYADRYGREAFKDRPWEEVSDALKTQPEIELRDLHSSTWLSFTIPGADVTLPGGALLHPTFDVTTDLIQDLHARRTVATAANIDFDLKTPGPSKTVREGFAQAGGLLAEIAKRPGFVELTRSYPESFGGRLTYEGEGRFELQLKFLAEDFSAMSIRYTVEADMEPRDVRYVNWLPITFRQTTGKVTSISTKGESRVAQLDYDKNEVLQTLFREDLAYEYDIPPPTVSVKKLSELEDLPASTESISLAQSIDNETAKELGRFTSLRHLSLSTERSDDQAIDRLPLNANLEHLSVYGKLTPKAIQSIVALPKLKELMVDVPDLRPVDLWNIFGISSLRKLYINTPNIDETGFYILAQNSTIRALTLGEKVALGDLEVASLGRMKGLDWLEIYGHGSGLDLRPIYRLPGLKHLHIGHVPLTDQDIAGIRGMPMLQSLMLDKVSGLTREQLFSFAKIRTLREFYLSQTPGIRAKDMRKLGSMLEGKWLRR